MHQNNGMHQLGLRSEQRAFLRPAPATLGPRLWRWILACSCARGAAKCPLFAPMRPSRPPGIDALGLTSMRHSRRPVSAGCRAAEPPVAACNCFQTTGLKHSNLLSLSPTGGHHLYSHSQSPCNKSLIFKRLCGIMLAMIALGYHTFAYCVAPVPVAGTLRPACPLLLKKGWRNETHWGILQNASNVPRQVRRTRLRAEWAFLAASL